MKSSELLRKLKADGWYILRQTGSHATMAHVTKKALTSSGYLTVTVHGSAEVGKSLERELLKQAGLK